MSSSVSEHSLRDPCKSQTDLSGPVGHGIFVDAADELSSQSVSLNMAACEETACSLFVFYIIEKIVLFYANFTGFLSENIIFKVFIYRPLSLAWKAH